MNTRQRREMQYNHEYTRALFTGDKARLELCVYCGMPATHVDHTLSLVMRDQGLVGDQYLVPACKKCNLHAGGKYFDSVYEKLQWLHHEYRKELKKYPPWSKVEIEGLEHSMKIYIQDAMRYRQGLFERIAWGKQIIKKVERKADLSHQRRVNRNLNST